MKNKKKNLRFFANFHLSKAIMSFYYFFLFTLEIFLLLHLKKKKKTFLQGEILLEVIRIWIVNYLSRKNCYCKF